MTATRITPGLAGAPTEVDVVVIGLGITGAGAALDAVTRGLSVLAVDAHDLAFGTSRWSSKLVHGGLRYLAAGQVGVAHESAVERGLLMEVTAPHLTHAIPTLMPFGSSVPRHQAGAARAATWAGDLLRRGARTSVQTLPRPRHLSGTEALQLAPSLRREGLRGAMLGWDGQLEDDARLVTTVARTAASYGAHVRTRARVVSATGTSVQLRDELTGASHSVTARTVINATGVWAGDLVDEVRLRPSRGTHLVLREETLPGLRVVVYAPDPGQLQPLRAGPPPARRHALRRPHRRARRRTGARRAAADRARDRLPARRGLGRLRAPHPPQRRGGRLRRAAPAARRAGRGRDRRHLAAARGPHQPHRRGHDRRRQADDLPPDGRGRARRCARPCRHRGGAVPHPHAAAARRGRPADPRRAGAARRASSAATAPTPHWCSRPRAAPPGSATTSCSCPSPRGSRSPWPSWCSASPTRARPT